MITRRNLIGGAAIMAGAALLSRDSASQSIGEMQPFDVRRFGAKGDGVTMDTIAVQAAIDACNKAGGGAVVFTPGLTFLIGTIYFKDHVQLEVQTNATLLGSDNLADYGKDVGLNPFWPETIDPCLIYAKNVTDIGIRGPGRVAGHSKNNFVAPAGATGRDVQERPMLVRLDTCSQISVADISMYHCGAWCMHLKNSREIFLRDVHIQNDKQDGFDLDSCQNVSISDCHLECGDDAIAITTSIKDAPAQSWWTENPVLHIFPHWNWPGYEGQKIAVWVHSNMDKVELLLNGQSLGTKEMPKNQHLAWDVEYAPGTIEARGYKDGKLALTAQRETTSIPSAIVLSVDRTEIAADGEDVAMVRVEIHDGKGRIVPITDNEIALTVTGSGRLLGTGNGDPTDQAPDKGISRKAFGGLCMGIVQSTKETGAITFEASSRGLQPATLTINTKAVTLRPQVAVWKRKIPQGSGITGLWRPDREASAELIVLLQEGGRLTGSAEGFGGSWAGGNDSPAPVEEGSVDNSKVSFRIAGTTYAGTIDGDRMELTRSVLSNQRPRPNPLDLANNNLVIDPAPDGSDPSRSPASTSQTVQPLVLRRVKGK